MCSNICLTEQLDLMAFQPSSLQPLRQILKYYELHGILPAQMIQSLIVMLPKNEQCERPITLTSTVYRLWCKLRKDLMDQWQIHLPFSMDYDRARPGQPSQPGAEQA